MAIVKWIVAGLLGGLLVTAGAQELDYRCLSPEVELTPVYRIPPAYPHAAGTMCLEGTVVLEFTVDEYGRVRDIEVLEAAPEGVFERAAIRAAAEWVYQPSCIDGQPVAQQQKTALDFKLDPTLAASCQGAADRLTGEYLEFVSAMGTLYSLFTEVLMRPDDMDLLRQLESAMQPTFTGDLGQVERFHHDYIQLLLKIDRQIRLNPLPPALRALMGSEFHSLPPGTKIDEEMLAFLRQAFQARLEMSEAWTDELLEIHAELQRGNNLDAQMLGLFAGHFAEDFDEVEKKILKADATPRLIASLLDLLERHLGDMQATSQGLTFADPDAAREHQEIVSQLVDHASRHQSQAWDFFRSFEDYRLP